MEQSKFSKGISNLRPSFFRSASAPVASHSLLQVQPDLPLSLPLPLATLAETEEESPNDQHTDKMYSLSPSDADADDAGLKTNKLSRMQRISSFLSPLYTNSKSPKEARTSTLRKAIPRSPQVVQSAIDLRPPPHTATLQAPRQPTKVSNPRSFSADPHSSSSSSSYGYGGRRVESPNRTKALPTPPQSAHSRHVSAEERGRRRSDLGSPQAPQGHGRVVSSPTNIRPRTANSPESDEKVGKISKRRSGFGLLRSRDSSPKSAGARPNHAAWVVNEGAVLGYELEFLLNGKMVRCLLLGPERE
jgi:hypothetical protein